MNCCETFTIGELAARVTGGNERTIRKLLNDAGADPRLDEYAETPAEVVSRDLVVDLYALRAADWVGRALGLVLSETTDQAGG